MSESPSESPSESRNERGDGQQRQARLRRTRWPGWVWLIPAVAAGVALYLAGEEWIWGPREITVRFADVQGVKPGAPVRYKGVQVGSVDGIRVVDGLGGVELALELQGVMEGHLGEGTRFWIVRPGLSAGEITNIISGAYIAVAPDGEGDATSFEGLAEAPIVAPDAPGRVFDLTADAAEGLSAGAPVRFRGLQVGRVLGVRFGDESVEVPVFVREQYAGLVRQASVFWRAGGLALSKGAGGLDVDLPSLGAIATGAVAFETPTVLEGPAAEDGASFTLYQTRDDASATDTGPRLSYALMFDQPAGGLARGAPVTLGGKTVGRVAAVKLRLAEGQGVSTPIGIVLDARQIGLDLDGIDTREKLRERMDALLSRLVGAGLRARLAEGGIVFGGQSIELVMQQDAAPAALGKVGQFPVIPTVGG